MLLQHGWAKGQPMNTEHSLFADWNETGRVHVDNTPWKKNVRREREHIFVTYLPKRWVQTNKMERVNIIPGDEWISPDIYRCTGYRIYLPHVILLNVKLSDIVRYTIFFKYLVAVLYNKGSSFHKCHWRLCVVCNPLITWRRSPAWVWRFYPIHQLK